MNGQLTLNDIYNVANELLKKGEKLENYPVYLGNDDELNGIHCGWYTDILDVNDDDEDNQYIIEMAYGLKNKGLLIS